MAEISSRGEVWIICGTTLLQTVNSMVTIQALSIYACWGQRGFLHVCLVHKCQIVKFGQCNKHVPCTEIFNWISADLHIYEIFEIFLL